MRTIQVSLDVFQAIWTQRRPDEQSEDTILRRLLKLPPSSEKANGKTSSPERDMSVHIGFHDPRYGVEIPSGFEIFRNYKGKEYRAQAIQGFWMHNGTGYPSLNELNKVVGGGAENAWKAWFYLDEKGRKHPMTDLRKPDTILRRSA